MKMSADEFLTILKSKDSEIEWLKDEIEQLSDTITDKDKEIELLKTNLLVKEVV
jgi:cell division protein FtsB